ncbi:MAG: hypothetical protein PUG10_06305 [Lachnospiraceae bacterium]|nr:hypothetical protein [Lachnospiraceae bacterium]
MEELNFIIRTNFDCDGITEEIISVLKDRFTLGKAIVLDCNNGQRNRLKGVEYWSGELIGSHDSLKLREHTHILEPDILEKMLPYKSMAMHIMMRECHYDIYDRHYLETVYYRHLKFWLSVVEDNQINCIINMTPPHHIGEYILYALAQIKNIPYVFLNPQISSKGVMSGLGTSWDKLGYSIQKNYNNKKKCDCTENDLSEYMQTAYQSVKNAVIMQSNDVEKLYHENRKQFLKFVSLGNILLDRIKIYGVAIKEAGLETKDIHLKNVERRLMLRRKARKTEKHMDHLNEYMKYSVAPDFSKPYVYYALHMTPEASTMPQAGEFKEQLLSIEILSKLAVELNFQVYVKEHWVQVHRDCDYYKTIAELPNVSLVDIKTNSIELIQNSIAVSTQTGNVIFESLIKQKPAIVFTSGYLFKGAPNVIQMRSYKELKEEMKQVLNSSFVINENDVLRYLKAMDEEMVFSYIDTLEETSKVYNKENTAKRIVDYLIKYNNMKINNKL